MQNKQKEILFAIIVLLAILVVLFFVLRHPAEKSDTQEDLETPTVVDQKSYPDGPDSFEDPIILPETTVRSFVERFGSFSSQSDFQNVTDVLPLVTDNLVGQLEQVRSASPVASLYYGVSTRVVSMTSVEQTDSMATFLVQTQREESVDSPGNTRVYYQEIEVRLLNTGDKWLIDGYTWKDEG